jgi:hypothetical protein
MNYAVQGRGAAALNGKIFSILISIIALSSDFAASLFLLAPPVLCSSAELRIKI